MMTEDMLTKAARSAAQKMNAMLPDPTACDHVFSSKFERRMKRLLSRANHPVRHRILRCAACIMLVLLVGFASVLTVNAEVRDQVFAWMRKQYETYYAYISDGEISLNLSSRFYPDWLPEGFELAVYDDNTTGKGGEHYTYFRADGEQIQFAWYPDTSFRKKYIANAEWEYREVRVNGLAADLYIAPTQEERSMLYWYDDNTGILFFISARDQEALLKIAENIMKK